MGGHDPFVPHKYNADAGANLEIIRFYELFMILVNCGKFVESKSP